MRYASLDDYLSGPLKPGPDPVGVVLCESPFLAAETVTRLRETGFSRVLALGPGAASLDEDAVDTAIAAPIAQAASRTAALNKLIAAHPETWMLVCFGGEFLFYPFCESRSILDFTEFLTNERRLAATAYAIDLYSDALGGQETSFSPRQTYFDTEGWYGFEREGRQAEVFGGVGWRFEEFMPHTLLRINRPALFRTEPGLAIRDDLWFGDERYDAISCPWHNNPTCALMSVRRAAALRSHPNFNQAVKTLMWPCSTKFEWRSDQLLSLGMIEAGQWL